MGALLAQHPNQGRGKEAQGQSWQALAPSHLLLPTPRTRFSSLAALGAPHPQPCWWVMARTSPPASAGPLCPLTTGLCPLCATQSPSPALPAGRDALTLALGTVMGELLLLTPREIIKKQKQTKRSLVTSTYITFKRKGMMYSGGSVAEPAGCSCLSQHSAFLQAQPGWEQVNTNSCGTGNFTEPSLKEFEGNLA